ncbi:SRPBCC family protein [Mucilaginibacter glaciei]|uniref:SRPBCC domain-containing protein n=1 Tax=Mucilaginibacter glaciei TaxID=2772109 RepID=A0A926NT08_9SPHI|nr:SRPBCC family protein [Mucilaginibacter glaciei]MBD1394773.1 SRPBCC domain-containing protein [Mucilaginibacter glaciei]
MEKLTLSTEVTFNATAAQVWKGLTNYEMVKTYFFGTELRSDFKKDSPITFSGEWDGNKYEDRGIILEVIPEEYLKYTYWSSMSGTEDKPENYANVSYALNEADSVTILTITQDNIKDENAKEHSENNWQMLMGELKKLLELPS